MVTKDVEPYAIVGGNPARLIKKRFNDRDIGRLLSIQWWDWPPEKLTRNVGLLTGLDLDALEAAAQYR